MRIKVATICGVDIIADPTCPINSGYFENTQMHSLAKAISDLDNILAVNRIKLSSISLDEAQNDGEKNGRAY